MHLLISPSCMCTGGRYCKSETWESCLTIIDVKQPRQSSKLPSHGSQARSPYWRPLLLRCLSSITLVFLPASLQDVFLAYLSLLYPPPGSQHTPVPASSLVIAGDSAGGNLCLSLLQLILHLQHRAPGNPSVCFHGRQVPVQLPAGVAVLSAYADLTHALPSWTKNQKYDYLPPENPLLDPSFPSCSLWPVEPKRANIYCSDTNLCHPLVSPVISKSWTGAPPLQLSYGEEMLVDEGKVIACHAARDGVTVVFEEYEAMPHNFPVLPVLNRSWQSQRCYSRWAEFCKACVNDPQSLHTSGSFVETDREKPEQKREVSELIDLSSDEVKERMKKREQYEIRVFNHRHGIEAKL